MGVLVYKAELNGAEFIDLKLPTISDGIYLIDIYNNANEKYRGKIVKM